MYLREYRKIFQLPFQLFCFENLDYFTENKTTQIKFCFYIA